MPAYHSTMNTDSVKFIGNVPLLPLKITAKGTSNRGPAPPFPPGNENDIVDESIDFFKARIETKENILINSKLRTTYSM